jgi:hypothetical protein
METIEKLETMYLDYLNNFITVSKFAEYYGISEYHAEIILYAGKKIFNLRIQKNEK